MAGPFISSLRFAVASVFALNLGYFFVEFGVAARIGSVSLFADSVDFLEDAMINFLIFAALGLSARGRGRVGAVLACLILVPGLATLWTVWEKFRHPIPPDHVWLSLTGAGALVVNSLCTLLLARHRHTGGSLAKAAFLSARNDVLANLAIIAAGGVTAWFPSAWPDLAVGVVIGFLNFNAAREVWEAARRERSAPL